MERHISLFREQRERAFKWGTKSAKKLSRSRVLPFFVTVREQCKKNENAGLQFSFPIAFSSSEMFSLIELKIVFRMVYDTCQKILFCTSGASFAAHRYRCISQCDTLDAITRFKVNFWHLFMAYFDREKNFLQNGMGLRPSSWVWNEHERFAHQRPKLGFCELNCRS